MIEPYNLDTNTNGLDMMLGGLLKNTFFLS